MRLVGESYFGVQSLMINQFVGREQVDYIVCGLSSLVNSCLQFLQSQGKPLEAP